jgi:uncharacterized protein (DUF1800 family)
MRWQPACLAAAVLAPGLAVLVGCASGGPSRPPAATPLHGSPAVADEAALRHFLSRTSFGATPASLDALRRAGVERYLESQMRPERIDDGAADARLSSFHTLHLSSREIVEEYYQPVIEARRAAQLAAPAGGPPAAPRPPTPELRDALRKQRVVLDELAEQKLLRAVYSERQLQEVLVDFWFNHFNVFSGKGADRGLITSYERDVIRPHVFGTFRELLGATAESPAMLFYLDNWTSVDPNGPHAPGPTAMRRGARAAMPPANARRAGRGLNENYARELMELHTLGVDGGYTQQDVIEVARCFTGWTITQPREGGGFRFDARLHDPGRKLVLGHEITGGGKGDGDKVLDLLARHPSTARFIATKLLRRFVADTPPPALVDRVAKRFQETGGDLRETYLAIFRSPEFWSREARAAKVKSPFEFVVSALRTTLADVTDASASVQAVRTLGMPLYGCQTPNGYGDTAETWVNTGALLNRMNFALALVDGRLAGARVDLQALAGPGDVAAARQALVARLLDDRAAPATAATIGKATTVPQVAALVLGSPEFQRR